MAYRRGLARGRARESKVLCRREGLSHESSTSLAQNVIRTRRRIDRYVLHCRTTPAESQHRLEPSPLSPPFSRSTSISCYKHCIYSIDTSSRAMRVDECTDPVPFPSALPPIILVLKSRASDRTSPSPHYAYTSSYTVLLPPIRQYDLIDGREGGKDVPTSQVPAWHNPSLTPSPFLQSLPCGSLADCAVLVKIIQPPQLDTAVVGSKHA